MLITLLIFIAILLALILSHEFGHFLAARFFGIRVDEFGIGIPPRILKLGKDKKGTLYTLNLLPFGGFVKIFGEEGEETNAPHSFGNKPAWARAVVLLSGVTANILLAYLVFTLVSALGIPEVLDESERNLFPDAKITIIALDQNTPAAAAGIQVGDQIKRLKFNNDEIIPQNIEDMQNFIKKHQGENILLGVSRGKDEFEKTILARQSPPKGEGPLGVALGYVHLKKSLWYAAPIDGAVFTWNTFKATITAFWGLIKNMFAGAAPGAEVAGPIGIFNITSSAKDLGINFLLLLLASLSINLAIINVLPFPGLDGGRLLFIFIEGVRRKKISPRTSAFFHSIGLAVLIVLMIVVTYHDIVARF